MGSDSKPRVSGQGGMVPQRPKPPIRGGNSQGSPGGSFMQGQHRPGTGGSGTAANKKPTP